MWKSLFPRECREICHTAPDGEIHRSGVRTPTGIYIEVQHSAMSDGERLSREAFYGNLIWVLGQTVQVELRHLSRAARSQIRHRAGPFLCPNAESNIPT